MLGSGPPLGSKLRWASPDQNPGSAPEFIAVLQKEKHLQKETKQYLVQDPNPTFELCAFIHLCAKHFGDVMTTNLAILNSFPHLSAQDVKTSQLRSLGTPH